MITDLNSILVKALTESLSVEGSEKLFNGIMSNKFSDIQLGAILAALRSRGETINEIAGAAKAMRRHSRRIISEEGTLDIVGTGGDGKGTLNISTASALVVAGMGVKVAKHGNRNVSSSSGSANVLDALGVNTGMDPTQAKKCLDEIGLCFMMAPIFHPAMKNVACARKELGVRTIFNILGPLTNPASVKIQLTGAFSKDILRPMAETLLMLGTKRAWIVHGNDGTDEISISATTYVVEINDGNITEFTINPTEYGMRLHTFDQLKGDSPDKNAVKLSQLLEGEQSAYRDSVILNSAAAFLLSGKSQSLTEGIEMAKVSIDSGKAKKKLSDLRNFSG